MLWLSLETLTRPAPVPVVCRDLPSLRGTALGYGGVGQPDTGLASLRPPAAGYVPTARLPLPFVRAGLHAAATAAGVLC